MPLSDYDQRRGHFEIERPLADQIRNAKSKQDRRPLYQIVYGEYRAQLAAHPELVRRDAQPSHVAMQSALVRPFLRPWSTFVELGAGDGSVAACLAPGVSRSIAFDVTAAIAVSGPPGYEFREFDGFDLGLEPASVDVVFSNDLVEHLHRDDTLDQMRAVHEVLRDGGRYICVTPNRLWGPHDVSRYFADTPQGFHLCEYTAGELAGTLRAAGFAHVQVLLSWRGRHLTPLIPSALATAVERPFSLLPRRLRLRIGGPLAAIKVVATK